jgi:hypothetical protein
MVRVEDETEARMKGDHDVALDAKEEEGHEKKREKVV